MVLRLNIMIVLNGYIFFRIYPKGFYSLTDEISRGWGKELGKDAGPLSNSRDVVRIAN